MRRDPIVLPRLISLILLAGAVICCKPSFASESREIPFQISSELRYAEGSGFWNAVDVFGNPASSPEMIAEALDHAFESPPEGFGSAEFAFLGPTRSELDFLFSHAYFGVGADYLAGGKIQNRILPEFDGYRVYTGNARFGFRNLSPSVHVTVGTTVGFGQLEQAQGSAVELFQAPPIDQSSLFYWGADLKIGFQMLHNPALRSRSSAELRPTLFHTDSTHSVARYEIEERDVTWRWRIESEWNARLQSPFNTHIDFLILGISGQQPIPPQFLPRTWDYVHQLCASPSAAQLFGLASGLMFRNDDDSVYLRLLGGFFGGYAGGGATLRITHFALDAGTYGVEQSPGYRISESRFRYLSLGVVFAL